MGRKRQQKLWTFVGATRTLPYVRVLLRDLPVDVGAGTADPDGVGARRQRGKSRYQASGAPCSDEPRAFLVYFNGGPIGHDDRVPALKQVPRVLL